MACIISLIIDVLFPLINTIYNLFSFRQDTTFQIFFSNIINSQW